MSVEAKLGLTILIATKQLHESREKAEHLDKSLQSPVDNKLKDKYKNL